jgi:hypothetical protein
MTGQSGPEDRPTPRGVLAAEKSLVTRRDAQPGHSTTSLDDLTNRSKALSHSPQRYSKIGNATSRKLTAG